MVSGPAPVRSPDLFQVGGDFAQADVLGSDLDELVFVDVGNAVFEGHFSDRGQDDVVVGPGRADIGELFAFGGVDDEIVVAG